MARPAVSGIEGDALPPIRTKRNKKKELSRGGRDVAVDDAKKGSSKEWCAGVALTLVVIYGLVVSCCCW